MFDGVGRGDGKERKRLIEEWTPPSQSIIGRSARERLDPVETWSHRRVQEKSPVGVKDLESALPVVCPGEPSRRGILL